METDNCFVLQKLATSSCASSLTFKSSPSHTHSVCVTPVTESSPAHQVQQGKRSLLLAELTTGRVPNNYTEQMISLALSEKYNPCCCSLPPLLKGAMDMLLNMRRVIQQIPIPHGH